MKETREISEVTFRALGPEHLDAVHRIELAAGPDPWSAALFAGELSGHGADREWLVALTGTADGDRSEPVVVGFGGLLLAADDAHVMNLAVDPGHQRRGIATGLLASLLIAAGDRGAGGATLEVRASSGPALGLYRRFGFVEAGRRPRYYPDGEEAVIMWAHKIYRADYRQRLQDLRDRA